VCDVAVALYDCQVSQIIPTNPILASTAAPSHATADVTETPYQLSSPFTFESGDGNMNGPSGPSIGWAMGETEADMNRNATPSFEGPGWLDPTVFPQLDNFLQECNNSDSDVFNSLTLPTAEPYLPQDIPVAQPAKEKGSAALPPQRRPKTKPIKSGAPRAAGSADVPPTVGLRQRPKPKLIHSGAHRAA